MSKSAWTIATVNLKNIKITYFITILCLLAGSSQYVVNLFMEAGHQDLSQQTSTSGGWMLWAVIPLAAIIIPARNFTRIVNLGGKRDNFLLGSVEVYALLAAVVSLISTVVYYSLDRPMNNSGHLGSFITVPETFGWDKYGPVCVFLQQFAFLLLFAAFVHTLVLMQDKWYGWAIDIVIIAIISVFTPITPLRHAEAWFFHEILFANPAIQIIACLVLAAICAALNKPILARKII